MSTKVQCDLCRLSYSTEKELLDHSLSLMHHMKLEDREKNPLHECPLCSVICSNMADYRRHISTDAHQSNLCNSQGVKDRKNDICESRKSTGIQISKSPHLSSSWSADANLNNSKKYMTDMSSHGKKVQDLCNGKFDQLEKNHQSGSHLRYDCDKADMASQMWDNDSWKARYNYRNDLYHWSKYDYQNQEHKGDICRKVDLTTSNGQKNSNMHSGTKVSPGYSKFNNLGRYFGMNTCNSDENRTQTNLPVCSYGLDDPSIMDFTADVIPSDWDENSFLEHEQFLHGVDTTYHSDRFHSVQTSKRTDVGKWEESSVRDRKRPRNEDDFQELLVKSSRSIDSSSEEHLPVRDVSRRHSGVFSTPSSLEVKPAADSFTDFKMQMKMSSIDNTSNNILERAERLCKELREKREASEAQKNLQLTKQNHEQLNKKMSALAQKQQMHYKRNIANSKDLQSDKSHNSAKQLQENGLVSVTSSKKLPIDSDAPEILIRATDNKLSSVKKSVDKSILENQKTGTSINVSVQHKSKQRSLSGGDIDLGKTKKVMDGLTDMTGKPILNPMSKLLLNKDNLKKMVNTPNARDERLQLVKMLHSRMEQKTTTTAAPRAHLQLEGLYDSVFASHDVNLDLERTCDSQTIKLENLSESVRQQIIDLIESDESGQSRKHVEIDLKSPNGLIKEKSLAQADVIILSDDEDLRNIRRNKKNSARKMSGSSTSSVIGDAAKTSKRKKILTEPSSNVGLKNKIVSSNSKSSPTNHVRSSRSTSPILKSNKVNKDTTLHSANKFLIISHSSDFELDKGNHTFQKENGMHNSSKTSLNDKHNFILVNSPDCKKYEGTDSENLTQLDSCSIREKFPTLLKIPKTDRTPTVKNNGALVGSEVASINSPHQNTADKSSDVSPSCLNTEADIKPVLPKTDVKLSFIKIDQETPSTRGSTEMANLEAQESHKLALLPSTWMINRTSPLHCYESQHRPFTCRSSVPSNENSMSGIPAFLPAFKESIYQDSPKTDILLLGDVDQRSADSAGLSVGESRTVMSDVTVRTSSQTMSTLLMLSEKEEYVKQEKMSMDLRLSRLHKLLEKAVVQINKCTERMNKLHEEEQELLKKRLSLLRVATSLQPSRRYDALTENNTSLEMKSHDKSENGQADFHTLLALDSGKRSICISQSLTNSTNETLALAENAHGTSLSKADWLAKFSSYLPQDSITANRNTTESVSLGNVSALKEQPHLSYSFLPRDSTVMKLNLSRGQSDRDNPCETVDVEMNCDKTSLKPELSDHLSQVSSSVTADKQRGGVESQPMGYSTVTSTNPVSVTPGGEPVIHSLISAPIMYVGSFRSTDHPMRLISPFVMEKSDTWPLKPLAETGNHFDTDNNLMVKTCQRREDNDVPTRDSVFADLMHLSSPSRSHNKGKTNDFGGEESDIGSVASSMASGSSLGEQITRYCRSTPGASIESRDPYGAHELSVIMSDNSEQRGLDSSAEEENDKSDAWLQKEHWHSSVRPCSVSLERLDSTCE